jgi:PiT family inorganic phosphate transporter
MDAAVLFFLSSGLFLGWSLGANDAANVFGTAVGTRMVRFATAAVICSVFVVLGAVISGAGAAHTLGKLGTINALGGSFMAAFSAALSVYLMTKAGLPVSTTQAIVGSIIGWNLFSEARTDTGTLVTILSTWIICPLLAAAIAALLFKAMVYLLRVTKPHLLRSDAYTRLGLILAGAFGAYSLGANNIANVMGVFVPASPFTDFKLLGLVTFSSTQQLFLIGALAIGVGVMTYSRAVMVTVGRGLMPLSPVAAWVAVVAHSLVLFLFASEGLERLLAENGLPTIPLVPVSSSQAVVGAVLGIGLIRGGRAIRWHVLGGIGAGWVLTPLIAGLFHRPVLSAKRVQPAGQPPHTLCRVRSGAGACRARGRFGGGPGRFAGSDLRLGPAVPQRARKAGRAGPSRAGQGHGLRRALGPGHRPGALRRNRPALAEHGADRGPGPPRRPALLAPLGAGRSARRAERAVAPAPGHAGQQDL